MPVCAKKTAVSRNAQTSVRSSGLPQATPRTAAEPVSLLQQSLRGLGNQAIQRALLNVGEPGLRLQRKCGAGGKDSEKSLARSMQRKLAINEPGDVFERQADQVAETVMRMADPAAVPPALGLQQNSPGATVQRACACGGSCDDCKKEAGVLQRAAVGPGAATAIAPPIVHDVLGSPGQPLDLATRNFMELRFGYDFSGVRVHADGRAAESARAVNALAYTVGNHVVLGVGQSQGTSSGTRLLAHELTHVVQQNGATGAIRFDGETDSAPDHELVRSGMRVQRKLSVDPAVPSNAPASDPARGLSSAARFSEIDKLIQALCGQFHINSSGDVESKSQQSLSPDALAAGPNPTGCCCLNILTDPFGSAWTIEVSSLIGAETDFGTHQVFLNPGSTTPVEFGAFTSSNTLAFQGAVPTAGHELCGHAALEEIKAHPPDQNRLTTDVHDPTVRMENQISTEQGVPAAQLRGLAGSGSHRGESVDKITIQNYGFNATDIPAGEQSKIDFAAEYIFDPATGQNEYVSILGHSDATGTASAKTLVSQQRAQKVKAALVAAGVPATITQFGLPTTNRFTRVQGVSDSQPPPSPLNGNPANWRRVEILMAGFPAGALHPPAATPTVVTPHNQNPNVPTLKGSSDACIRKLVGEAYP